MDTAKLSSPSAANADPVSFLVEVEDADQQAVTPCSSASLFPKTIPDFIAQSLADLAT